MTTEGGLVIGIDAGGSHTRALVAGTDGQRVGAASAAGANPVVHGWDQALTSVSGALRAALVGVDPNRVRLLVPAIAGIAAKDASRLQADVRSLCHALGFACPVYPVSDLEAAFAGGTASTNGVVVLSGTGAVAGLIHDGRLVRQIDGYGWLVGDEGSGFWLGREAVRAALAALDGRGSATGLVADVAEALDVTQTPDGLVTEVYQHQPIRLAELAPIVTKAAAAGDAVAIDIIRCAADALLTAVSALHPPGRSRSPTRIVLAGGVLTGPGPVADIVIERLRAQYDRAPVLGTDGAAGAAWIGLGRILQHRAPSTHARLIQSAD
ncbi:N-acetylglucosamine kinase [Jiangella asiatica]|uniref:N-acetylglucosamine kinase n=1 Tax=Jiangella asiatica TaxID=2530372 RepID=UPI0013A5E113|nr:BadF/BadG/BcrA/BcrD ATPase family protein [Jiangella asiatica]